MIKTYVTSAYVQVLKHFLASNTTEVDDYSYKVNRKQNVFTKFLIWQTFGNAERYY